MLLGDVGIASSAEGGRPHAVDVTLFQRALATVGRSIPSSTFCVVRGGLPLFKMKEQLPLKYDRTWGGRRDGAGRPRGTRRAVARRTRALIAPGNEPRLEARNLSGDRACVPTNLTSHKTSSSIATGRRRDVLMVVCPYSR
jgi:hypothetical protein